MLSAAKWGALVGVGSYFIVDVFLTIFAVVVTGTAPADPTTNPGKYALGCLSIFLLLFAFSAAGYFTGRETRKAGLGAVAGMITLVCYAIPSAIFTPSSGSVVASPKASAPVPNQTALFISQIAAGLIVLGIAALMGWLGGRPGAQRARKRTAVLAPEGTPPTS